MLNNQVEVVVFILHLILVTNLPLLDKPVFKEINCATHTLWYLALRVLCFISHQFSL